MEHPLSKAARQAPENNKIERRKSYCYRAFRQLRQAVYGSQFDQYDDDSERPTAKKAERRWADSPYVVDQDKGTLPGDVFFFGDHGPDGHVGIRVPGNLLFDNSESSVGRVVGAKGFRRLQDMGKPTLVIRLPRTGRRRKRTG